MPKSPQLLALKSAERFIQAEWERRMESRLPDGHEYIREACDVLHIVKEAIVQGELEYEKEQRTCRSSQS